MCVNSFNSTSAFPSDFDSTPSTNDQNISLPKVSSATTIPQKTALQILSQPTKIQSSQEEYIKNTLTLILSDHLEPIIEAIYKIFAEALTDTKFGPPLARRLLTLFSNTSKQLPTPLNSIATYISPEHFERHIPFILKLSKNFMDGVLGNDKIRTALITSLSQNLAPLFTDEPRISTSLDLSKEIPERQKTIIVAVIKGLEHFFEDLTKSMSVRDSFFKTSNYDGLRSKTLESTDLEKSIFNEMNQSLKKRDLLTSLSPSSSNQNENNELDLFTVTQAFLDVLLPNSQTSQEKDAIVYLATLCISKCVELYFSPRTMLYLLDLLLNLNPEMVDVKAEQISSIEDKHFAEQLDLSFQNLVLHGAHLGTGNTPSYIALMTFLYAILKLNQGKMGKEGIISIYKAINTPHKILALNSIYKLLYAYDLNGVPVPALKNLYSETDAEIEMRREKIEGSLKANVPFEKINSIIRNVFQNGPLHSKSLTSAWDFFNIHCDVFKSICKDTTNSIYVISQRDSLIKMLYSYIVLHIHKALIHENRTRRPGCLPEG